MVVWLRHGPCTVGIEHGVVRADAFAQLVSMTDAAAALDEQLRQRLSAARAEADALLIDARAEAARLRAEAEVQAEQAREEGRARGEREALVAATQRALEQAAGARNTLERQQDRLRDIVTTAVERVIGETDRKAVFARALATISKLVKDVPMLTLRVHAVDRHSAQAAVQSMLDALPGVPIEVVGDASLRQGSCLFESDLGVIDAGLDTQLAAIRRAVANAAQRMVSADGAMPRSAQEAASPADAAPAEPAEHSA
jgi:type III secretion protein L